MMTMNEAPMIYGKEKSVFSNEERLLQWLNAHPDSVIFNGITMDTPRLSKFWECYAEQEPSVDVPSFRKMFNEAGLELDINIEMRWKYTRTWSGHHSISVNECELLNALIKRDPSPQAMNDELIYNDEDYLEDLVDEEDLDTKMNELRREGGNEGVWELTPVSCHFYLHPSVRSPVGATLYDHDLEEHEEVA